MKKVGAAAFLGLAALTVAAVLVLRPAEPGGPGFRDFDEFAAAISDIEGYEAECVGTTGNNSERFDGGTVETDSCDLSRDGEPVGETGQIRLTLVKPAGAMDEFVSSNRKKSTDPESSIVGESWLILGIDGFDTLRADLLAGLDGAREDPNGVYNTFRPR